MIRIALRSACLLAFVGVWALAPVFAKEPEKGKAKLSNSAPPEQVGKAASAEVAIPGCLETLNLSPMQREQIQGIVRDYDADIDVVWGQFGVRYRATIGLECSLLAAIEDNLTESQRTCVRDERRKVAHHAKSVAGTNSKPNQATSKPDDAVQEEIGLPGVSLTAEQESIADKIQEKYLNHLRSLNRDIQGLHTRLVSLEADKLVEIESVLTKAQLTQLREIRQTTPAGPGDQISSSASTKSK